MWTSCASSLRCAFCNTDDLKMAIENKKKLPPILKRLRQFSSEVYLLMDAHMCCVPLSWIKLSVKSGKHTQRVDIIRCFGNSNCCDAIHRCTRKPWRSCLRSTRKQSLRDWDDQHDAQAMVRRRASSNSPLLLGQKNYCSRRNAASSAMIENWGRFAKAVWTGRRSETMMKMNEDVRKRHARQVPGVL